MSQALLDGRLFGEENPCFGCGPSHRFGFHLGVRVEGQQVTAEFTPSSDHQGPPGIMHGGLVTTLADEIAAWTLVALRDRFGFTVAMKSRFPRAVRIGIPIEGRGEIVRNGERMPRVRVELFQQGEICFTSEMTFIIFNEKQAEKMLGLPLPESWRKYCR
jgi:acyl-coenzyme A thioesterase PaaI-like protein